MRWPLYLACILCSLHKIAARYQWKRTVQPKKLDEIKILDFGESLRFQANESWAHRRTEVLWMGRRDCVEARFRVEGKRTRLRVYTCHMAEGGMCSMDRYFSEKGAHFCHQFHPWYHAAQPYTLHVQVERRPRRFKDIETERRFRRRRFGRAATRNVAEFEFVARKSCQETCKRDPDDDTGFTTQLPQFE
ncbi:unnamed protein product [Bursaphelenchus xylophilus]|uniref:(pine wood nematode) hypothetical protein n=1 Tax=Bursaphelenchus xylophilus TaxID=6326 RepID=A0A1I7SCD7_BURXY|nr:unnamed protein product [Bursaphelenchus xylophilus]CAG9094286.1 unnamed protein product [Bursaphelenchus xylophilus]